MIRCVLAVLGLFTAVARADEFATSPLRPGYVPSDHLFDFARRDALEQAGVTLEGTYALDTFVAPQLDQRLFVGGLFVLDLDLDLANLVTAGLGAAHIDGFVIHGKGVTDELMDIYGVSGNTAPTDVRLFEAWIEQPIGAFTLRAGSLAADQEFIISDHSSTLLGATFGITSQFSYNVIGPVYPVATPGLSGRLELDHVTTRVAVYDGTQTNSHGIPTALGPDRLVIGEIELVKRFKLGGWHHSDRGSAVYVVADAQLDEQLGAFARAGVSPDTPIHTYVDAGVRITPGVWRPEDFVSLGMAFARTDDGAQIALEASYEAQINWLTIQPDFQLMMLRERTVAMVATRVTVVF